MIVVDTREKGSLVPAKLEELKVPIEYRTLEIGDYLIGNLCVERKEIGDYVGSLIEGRLNNQLYELSYHYSHSILLVEGFVDEVLWMRKIKRSVYISSLAGAICKKSIEGQQGVVSVVMVSSPYDTALLLYYLDEKVSSGEFRMPQYNPEPKWKMSRIVSLVCSLPGVGETRGLKLLEKFNSIEDLVKASVEQIDEVEGIGTKTAQEIWKVLHSKYLEEK